MIKNLSFKIRCKTKHTRHELIKALIRILAPRLYIDFQTWRIQWEAIKSVPRPMTLYLKSRFQKLPLTGIEIGLGLGENALSLLQELNLEKLYSVELGKSYLQNGDVIKTYHEVLDETLHKFKEYSNFHLILDDSVSASKIIPEQVDFVYIDGNHEHAHVIADFWTYYPLVKKGGIIGGHDAINYFDVTKAISEISAKLQEVPFIHKADWWFIKKGE